MSQALPNLGTMTGNYALGEDGWDASMNTNLQTVDDLLQLTVISTLLAAPPGSPANGARYIVPVGAAGAWTGHDQQIARWDQALAQWQFYTARSGWSAYSTSEGKTYRFLGSMWNLVESVNDLRADLANSASSIKGPALVGRGATLNYPSGTTGARLYGSVTITEMGGDPTGVTNADAAVAAAVATGLHVIVNGKFRITTPVQPTQAGMSGIGPKISGFICTACDGILIPPGAGFDRPACVLQNFSINSDNGTSCDNNWAFNVPGVGSGAAAVYNSGLIVRDVEIGRSGRMGGGFYLKDLFRFSLENVGLSDVSWMVRMVGSVVQGKLRNVISNNDSAATALTRYGISTETATYSGVGVLVPENIRAIDCAYIRGSRGINHTAGLDIEFENFDTESDAYGAVLNAPCTMSGGILVPGPAATAWVGISRGVSIATPDDGTIIKDVDINCLRAPSAPESSYGLDAGDGVSPVFGLTVTDLRVRGIAGSLQSAIRGRIMNGDAAFFSPRVRHSVCLSTDIDIQSGRTIVMQDASVPGGAISINDAGDATAGGRIVNSICTTLTKTLTSDNWTFWNPAVTGETTRGVSERRATFTGTLTGCTTAPTGALRYVIHGRQVTLYIPPITGTSNTNACTITGMPAEIFPNRQQDGWGTVVDNSNTQLGAVRVSTAGLITFFVGANFANFTASNSKGSASSVITYSLD